jgi:hypothetical protein
MAAGTTAERRQYKPVIAKNRHLGRFLLTISPLPFDGMQPLFVTFGTYDLQSILYPRLVVQSNGKGCLRLLSAIFASKGHRAIPSTCPSVSDLDSYCLRRNRRICRKAALDAATPLRRTGRSAATMGLPSRRRYRMVRTEVIRMSRSSSQRARHKQARAGRAHPESQRKEWVRKPTLQVKPNDKAEQRRTLCRRAGSRDGADFNEPAERPCCLSDVPAQSRSA